jgi:hypothetical protein
MEEITMPDDISQAAPTELVTPTGAQVPETITPQVNPPEEPQKETPLTPEQIAAIEKIADQRAARIAQSQSAKSENRIQKTIQDRFKALEQTKSTLGLTDDQVKQAQQKIVTEAYASPEETTPTTQPAPEVTDADQAIQYMNAQIANVFEEVGTSVTRTDPEFTELQKAVDASWNDPKGLVKILRAAEKAATTKAARLQTTQQNAAGRVVGGGSQSSGQAQPQARTSLEGWEQAYKKE